MGQKAVKALTCGLYNPNQRQTRNRVINQHIQVLVIGDQGVGKTTLINNYVSEANEVEFTNNTELIRIVNANQFINDPQKPDENHHVSLTLVDVNGGINNINKQIRDGYYTTSQIILVLYNVSSNTSLYNTLGHWQKEMAEATTRITDAQADGVQLVLVGVNPEARDQIEVLPDSKFEYDQNANPETLELFRKTSQRQSVNKSTAAKLTRQLSYRQSKRKTKHEEVGTNKQDIKRFFQGLISDYIFPPETRANAN